jgi:hypothetical protein
MVGDNQDITIGISMRFMRINMSFCLLLTGCYSQATITEDTANSDSKELTFYLKDGSYIVSQSGQHHRVENGYELEGELVKIWSHTPDPWNPLNSQPSGRAFDGIVLDEDINGITVTQFNTVLTILAVGVPLAVVVGLWLLRARIAHLLRQ